MSDLPGETFLTLAAAAAADRLGWSRKSLLRALARHGIPTVGRGRLARLASHEFARLVEAETCHGSCSGPASAGRSGTCAAPSPASGSRSYRSVARQLRVSLK